MFIESLAYEDVKIY